MNHTELGILLGELKQGQLSIRNEIQELKDNDIHAIVERLDILNGTVGDNTKGRVKNTTWIMALRWIGISVLGCLGAHIGGLW